MKVLITGADGQLGRALAATAGGAELVTLGRNDLDIRDEEAVSKTIADVQPGMIINAAAYTAVDRAESEEALALAINGSAVGYIERAARQARARLVQISTDFVFDGTASRPYPVSAAPAPLNAYGRTKLVGEQAAGDDALIVRTAWVYAAGGSNFVQTMLRLMADLDEVRVVADQVGTPTYATSLAQAIWRLAEKKAQGIFHYTDSGLASWYDFAVAIQEESLALGLLQSPARIVPIASEDYPTPARRPPYSVLDKTETVRLLGEPASHWRANLRLMLQELAKNG
jgi:dTDP-4-dehydrorhamnose reductase